MAEKYKQVPPQSLWTSHILRQARWQCLITGQAATPHGASPGRESCWERHTHADTCFFSLAQSQTQSQGPLLLPQSPMCFLKASDGVGKMERATCCQPEKGLAGVGGMQPALQRFWRSKWSASFQSPGPLPSDGKGQPTDKWHVLWNSSPAEQNSCPLAHW